MPCGRRPVDNHPPAYRAPPYSGEVPLRPDPSRAGAVLAQLDALRAAVTAAEEDVLACLVVTGEPRPQRVLDDWLDQVADTLRALDERATTLAPAMGRHAVPPPGAPDSPSVGRALARDRPDLGSRS
jgi:hypothetical protein